MENKILPRNKDLKHISRVLRNHATPEENHLWYEFLRTYPVRFNRQRIIGDYVVDFYCSKAKLVIELDGSQHFARKGVEEDKVKSDFLENLGLQVLRFSNTEIHEAFYEVCTIVDNTVKTRVKL